MASLIKSELILLSFEKDTISTALHFHHPQAVRKLVNQLELSAVALSV